MLVRVERFALSSCFPVTRALDAVDGIAEARRRRRRREMERQAKNGEKEKGRLRRQNESIKGLKERWRR